MSKIEEVVRNKARRDLEAKLEAIFAAARVQCGSSTVSIDGKSYRCKEVLDLIKVSAIEANRPAAEEDAISRLVDKLDALLGDGA